MSDYTDLIARLAEVAWLAEEGSEVTDLANDAREAIGHLRAEVERLREERDDHKARLAVEAVTAPDADYDTMMDSLQARIRDMWAEVERLNLIVLDLAVCPAQLAAERALADQLATELIYVNTWLSDKGVAAIRAWEAARHE